MTIFPEFEQELRRVARRAAGATGTDPRARRTLRLRWLRKTTAMLPVAASVLVAIAIAAIAIAALGHRHTARQQSAGGGPGERLELRYTEIATRRAFQSAACRDRGGPQPNVSRGSPSGSFLSVLGVLRRAARTADALPQSLRSATSVRRIYLTHVRLAVVKGGVSYYVVPAGSLSPSRPLTTACDSAIRSALNRELAQIPAPLRAATLRMSARQQRFRARLGAPGVCLMTESRYAVDGVCGASASEIARQGMITDFGLLSGIVPDGVATVTAHYAPTRTSRAHTITSNVVGNVFATSLRIPYNTVDLQPTLIWRSATGAILKTVSAAHREPNRGSGFCGDRAALPPGMHIC